MLESSKIPLALSFDDVLLVPKHSDLDSRSEVDLSVELAEDLSLEIPLISTKMDMVTGVKMAVKMGQLGGMGILPRFESIESQAGKVARVIEKGVVAAAAVGVKEGFRERAKALVKAGARVIDVDVAHGHLKKTIRAVEELRESLGERVVLLAGIVATKQAARDLYQAGADCLLVGVGGGSTCTTRVKTGCGVPVLTSLWAVEKVARERGKSYLVDAGVRNSGDVVKALAAGASGVVGGNIFAGTDEAPGEVLEMEGRRYKQYHGSASEIEKRKQVKLRPEDKGESYVKHVEGVEGLVEYKGPVEEQVEKILAGVRSGFSYCGARNLKELWERAEFIRITRAGWVESGAHDVIGLERGR